MDYAMTEEQRSVLLDHLLEERMALKRELQDIACKIAWLQALPRVNIVEDGNPVNRLQGVGNGSNEPR